VQLKLANNTHIFPQGRGVKQGCTLSPTLFNRYINKLARALEQSAAPRLTLLESEVKCLLFADDLMLLFPTKEGLQQHLDLLHRLCQIWALTVNLSKTKIMVFQKRSSCKDHKYHLDTIAVEHAKKLYIIHPKHRHHKVTSTKLWTIWETRQEGPLHPPKKYLNQLLPFVVVRSEVRSPTKTSQKHPPCTM
jgi:hypothetical protein